jgi:hypothetical protein
MASSCGHCSYEPWRLQWRRGGAAVAALLLLVRYGITTSSINDDKTGDIKQ